MPECSKAASEAHCKMLNIFILVLLKISYSGLIAVTPPKVGNTTIDNYHGLPELNLSQNVPLDINISVLSMGPQTKLVLCQALCEHHVGSLKLKCRNRYQMHVHHFHSSSHPVKTNSVMITERLLVTIDEDTSNQETICYCHTDDKRNRNVISIRFSRNGIKHGPSKPLSHRTVTFHGSRLPAPLQWTFPISARNPMCFHDNTPVKTEASITNGTVEVTLPLKTSRSAGVYSCSADVPGLGRQWGKLIELIISGWSAWYVSSPCSAKCGPGFLVKRRSCLSKDRTTCKGPTFKTESCSRYCEESAPVFIQQPHVTFLNNNTVQMTCTAIHTQEFQLRPRCDVINGAMLRDKAHVTLVIDTHKDGSKTLVLTLHPPEKVWQGLELACCCEVVAWGFTTRSEKLDVQLARGHSTRQTLLAASHPTDPQHIVESTQRPGTPIIVLSFFITIYILVTKPYWMRSVRHDTTTVTTSTSRTTTSSMYSDPAIILHGSSCNPSREEYSRPQNPMTLSITPPEVRVFTRQLSQGKLSNSPRSTTKLCMMANEDIDEVGTTFDLNEESDLSRRGSSKSNASTLSALSSVSKQQCPRPSLPERADERLCAWGRIDHNGGQLVIPNTGISLYVPPSALPQGQEEVIYIAMMKRSAKYPQLRPGQALLSPAVVCGPEGLQFNEPVFLKLPHNAALKNGEIPHLEGKTRSGESTDATTWRTLESLDGDPESRPISYLDENSVEMMLTHFSDQTVVGEPEYLKIKVVPFLQCDGAQFDCRVQVYLIPRTKAALEEAILDASRVGLIQADTGKLFSLMNTSRDVRVKACLHEVDTKWKPVTPVQQALPFSQVWSSVEDMPNVTFGFAPIPDQPNLTTFRCNFEIQQYGETDLARIFVTYCIKDHEEEGAVGSSASTPTSSPQRKLERWDSSSTLGIGSEMQGPNENKIPRDIRIKLCIKLEPADNLMIGSWKDLAGKIPGITTDHIRYLEGRKVGDGPVGALIDYWETSLSEKIPLHQLAQLMEDIGRRDAAELVESIFSTAV
ncbi:predicted protein [Nematostella vectensis]|uniref:Netrin receptor UNC5 n=1 Tax=Nematostella vectensis TaxID=45351 RepID=A7RPN0_NEMVE|nr:predicted protein [Nematostella vectensis]|eukprot:XP_001638664.1 predicted protein [Nematostella vectensis]